MLDAASDAMDDQDEAEAYQRNDPVAYVKACRARRNLLGRLRYGRR